ncbi:MAG: glycerol-3-phosphate acyltransferase [bacterium]
MSLFIKYLILFISSYIIGSIPTAYLLAHYIKGIKLSEYGSKSIGAMNLGSVMGRSWTLLTIFLDAWKGALPVLVGMHFGGLAPYLAGTSAVLGHNFSIFLRFGGGRGIATTGGVLFFLSPWTFWLSMAINAFVRFITGYSFLSNLAMALCLPLLLLLFKGISASLLLGVPVCILIILAYIKNPDVDWNKNDNNYFSNIK